MLPILPLTSTAEQQARSTQLLAIIEQAIKAAPNHAISFAHYMKLALYTPELGYYMADHPVFGWEGDFTTAPELSPLFGQCLARSCLAVLETTGGDILEIGAGGGKLAGDLLRALPVAPEHYYIYEISPALRKRQQAYLQQYIPELYSRVVWLESLPKTFTGMIIANEVMDALPADIFHISESGIQSRGVTIKEGKLSWVDYPASSELKEQVEKIQSSLDESFSPPYTSEIQLGLEEWTKTLAGLLKKGSILLIDYGFLRHEYYHPQRYQGTLMCHYKQHAHGDPFWNPGLQDITVHVDFTTVGETAENEGLSVKSYTTQAQFLLECGLIDILQNNPELDYAAKHQVQILTSPAEMGELFKVLWLEKS